MSESRRTSLAHTTIHYQDRWAVVTGASSGLGRGLAARLADGGMSLVLTGRNQARVAGALDRGRPLEGWSMSTIAIG